MSLSPLELLITLPSRTTPVRASLRRALTTIGSSDSADVRIEPSPPHWLVAQRHGDDVEICELASGARYMLQVNQSLTLSSCHLLLSPAGRETAPLPVAHIADALASVSSADEALTLLLQRVMQVTRASSGAIIVSERGSYHVAVALDEHGRALAGGERLLSDTIVRDALGGGDVVSARDLAADERYRSIPSVVDLQLGAVLAVPMVLGERVLGAIYLGRQDARARFDDAHARDISVVASMAIPFLAQLRRAGTASSAASGLIGESPPMVEVRELIARVAPTDLSVLIGGETGTGKEVTARAIHEQSHRSGKPMIALNCSAITPALLEAELFGYRKGAFTGAITDREGRIEAANGSTLFLDEVGDMPLPMQAALLRVLQEREIVRIGENQPRAVDFRLVAATHQDLDAAAADGRFRADLLYRLRELPLLLPPLRSRGDDIVLLANLFLRQAETELGIATRRLSGPAAEALAVHQWPGNVRELRSTIRRAAVLASSELITPAELGLSTPLSRQPAPGAPDLGGQRLDQTLADAKDEFVRRYVQAVIDAHDGNREAAAAALGISLRSLYRHQ